MLNAKWKITILTALLSVTFLSGCNVDNNEMNQHDGGNYRPVRYNPETNQNTNNFYLDNNRANNRTFEHDENHYNTGRRLNNGDDLEFDRDRGAE